MATLMVRVSEGQKQLWVEAAFDERVSLSEWVRRQCDAGLTAGDPGGERRLPGASAAPSVSRPAPAVSPVPLDARAPEGDVGKHSFRPDFKKERK